MISYYLTGIFLAFLQPVWSVVFWPGLVVTAAAYQRMSATKVYFLAFVLGLLGDLLSGRFLGLSAVFLLLVAATIFLVKNYYGQNWRLVVLALVVWEIVFRLRPLFS